ncbi:MAG: YkgJ family cysteine cluster protein [Chitinispirillales bacterium]|jgi:Fe-S-cluster containining protein|nr:YkgJ family cysteine cluster protein [Chitinispirillales bacterium]
MKKREKKSYVKCVRCGGCCRVPVVPVTHRDLERLVKFTGTAPNAIVRFCPFSEMEYDSDSGLWIKFRYGKHAMVLRKRSEKCIFQTPMRSCSAYEARPQTCRTFPYSVDTDDSENVEINLNEVFDCNAAPCEESDVDIDTLLSDSLNETCEDAEYHNLVKRWNKSENKGGTADFLKFIGF